MLCSPLSHWYACDTLISIALYNIYVYLYACLCDVCDACNLSATCCNLDENFYADHKIVLKRKLKTSKTTKYPHTHTNKRRAHIHTNALHVVNTYLRLCAHKYCSASFCLPFRWKYEFVWACMCVCYHMCMYVCMRLLLIEVGCLCGCKGTCHIWIQLWICRKWNEVFQFAITR